MIAQSFATTEKTGGVLTPFRDSQFLLIFCVALFVTTGNFMLTLSLPLYAAELGAGAKAIGLLSSIFATSALVMRPFSGQLIDNEDKRKVLLVSLSVMLGSLVGLALADRYWMLLVFRGFCGLSWGIGSTLCLTIACESVPEKRMAAGIGVYALGQTIALTLAPAIALPVAGAIGYGALYGLITLLIAASIVMAVFIRPRPPIARRGYSLRLESMISLPSIKPAAMTLVNNIAKSSISAFLAICARQRGVAGIGLFFSVQAAAVFVFRPAVSALSDRYGVKKVLIPCQALLLTGFILVAYAGTLPAFLVAAVILGIAIAGEQPILMAESMRCVGPSQRGVASNTSYVGLDLGIMIGSNMAGLLVDFIGYRAMFLAITAPMILYTAYFISKGGSEAAGYDTRSHP